MRLQGLRKWKKNFGRSTLGMETTIEAAVEKGADKQRPRRESILLNKRMSRIS
jgi:hypothetical protein